MTCRFRPSFVHMKPIRIGIIGYDAVQGLDLIGPSDAFTLATDEEGRPHYEVLILGLSPKPFRTESGILITPTTTLRRAPTLDTLIIPGGRGARLSPARVIISQWVSAKAQQIRRIASVCTGIYALAPTGLLDHRRVTTHWRFADDVTRSFPKLRVDHDALYLKDGGFYTAGGITASVDLALALIEEDYGPRVALTVARDLVVYLKRAGGQKQYSEPLEFQVNSSDRFADLASWVPEHLQADLSLPVLARRVGLSPRQFHRRFKSNFGRTPAAFVESLRLDEARRRLSERTQTIEGVAASVGFHSDDAFRFAFQRRFKVTPGSYRDRFDMSGAGNSRNRKKFPNEKSKTASQRKGKIK